MESLKFDLNVFIMDKEIPVLVRKFFIILTLFIKNSEVFMN